MGPGVKVGVGVKVGAGVAVGTIGHPTKEILFVELFVIYNLFVFVFIAISWSPVSIGMVPKLVFVFGSMIPNTRLLARYSLEQSVDAAMPLPPT